MMGGGSHPSRSRFFDVPMQGPPPHQQQHPPPPPPQQGQPGTPSGDPSVVGRKLTFAQFKQAAAAGGMAQGGPPHQPPQGPGGPTPPHHHGPGMPPPPPPGAGPPDGPPGMPPHPGGPPGGNQGKVLTMAELENKMTVSRPPPGMPPPGMPPPPGMGFPPPPAGERCECGVCPGLSAAQQSPGMVIHPAHPCISWQLLRCMKCVCRA
jgi:hypothetical protein